MIRKTALASFNVGRPGTTVEFCGWRRDNRKLLNLDGPAASAYATDDPSRQSNLPEISNILGQSTDMTKAPYSVHFALCVAAELNSTGRKLYSWLITTSGASRVINDEIIRASPSSETIVIRHRVWRHVYLIQQHKFRSDGYYIFNCSW